MSSDDTAAVVLMLAMMTVGCSCSSLLAVFAIKKSKTAPAPVKAIANAVGAPIETAAIVAKKATAGVKVPTPKPAATSGAVTAPLATRVAEMAWVLANGFSAGKNTSKQMTGSDGRIYFVVPNGTENDQLKGLVELTAVLRKVYASALKRHGKDDVYTSRLSTLLEDPNVSYVEAQDFYQGNNSFTSLYPAGKPAAAGVPPHPYICMVPWWQSIIRDPRLMPKDEAAFKSKVKPYWYMLFFHEVGHAIAGAIGHSSYWLRAWSWVMHEAEAAGVWTHASLLAIPNDIMSKDFFKFDPNRIYSWDPYEKADLDRASAAADKLGGEMGQQIVLWENPLYKKGLGCPCS